MHIVLFLLIQSYLVDLVGTLNFRLVFVLGMVTKDELMDEQGTVPPVGTVVQQAADGIPRPSLANRSGLVCRHGQRFR